ncbi:MAG: U32 family peptidase, partial [Clostridium sp.]
EYCPIGSTFGEKTSCSDCNIACSRDEFTLVDRMDASYRVMTDLFCRSYILDETPINTIAEVEDLKSFGVNSFRVEFRDETYEEVRKVISMARGEIAIDKSKYTTGLYRKGID